MGDNEKLYTMDPCLHLKRFWSQVGNERMIFRSADQNLNYSATGAWDITVELQWLEH